MRAPLPPPLRLSTEAPFEAPLPGGGSLRWAPAWLGPDDAGAGFAALLNDVPWAREHVRIAGRSVPQPRLSAWQGDPEAVYTYSGLRLVPAPWHPLLLAWRDRLAAETGLRFNGALLNLYRDGADAMGFHADDERELGPDPVVASLSLGAARDFVLRPRDRHGEAAPRVLRLTGGGLLLMGPGTQRTWKHGVPREAGAGARINVTWRRIDPRR